MRDLITVIASTLGVLLILAGATIIVLRAIATTPARPAPVAEPSAPVAADTETTVLPTVRPEGEKGPSPVVAGASRVARAAYQLPEADRLIGWGIVLLIIAAISAGSVALSFSIQAGQ